ncbi:hypothetical protein C7T35_39680 [Variovorax sp. WS11]|uniref:hypothetical protein n=1 Tax=Variovorax sp. WS11 TaxID=1105204 RepID=UPI000D0DA657|nr:hypothetical protein [Variovorax sp. WS11]NDZ11862.1 hypothetical protein [Variovorax sp. WS11]PSL79051.1 hypothetical protein C7T35_39680 [Variovorax sp. WS11]
MTSQRDWSDFARRLALRLDFDLMTVLEVDWSENLVRRSFSTDETNYPSAGVKRLMSSSWANHVIFGGQVFRSQTRAEFRSAFEDYKTLEALDLFFALNVPCQERGRTVRTVNLLRGSSAFPEQAIEAVRVGLDAW